MRYNKGMTDFTRKQFRAALIKHGLSTKAADRDTSRSRRERLAAALRRQREHKHQAEVMRTAKSAGDVTSPANRKLFNQLGRLL